MEMSVKAFLTFFNSQSLKFIAFIFLSTLAFFSHSLEDEKKELFLKIKLGQLNEVKSLIKTEDINTKDEDGNTPLHVATYWEKEKIVEHLLTIDGVDVNIQNNKGETACYIAASSDDKTQILEHLIGFEGMDPNLANKDNKTPLNQAIRLLQAKAAITLLKHPETDPNLVLEGDLVGERPLTRAARNDEVLYDVVVALLNHKKTDPNLTNYKKQTPLTIAARWGQEKSTKALIDHEKTNPNLKAFSGETPLHLATKHIQAKIIPILFTHKDLDVNAKNEAGLTALMIVAYEGFEDVAKELLKHKDIDLYQKSPEGRSPLQIAEERTNEGVVKLLEDKIAENKKKDPSETQITLK